jgi:hypothetical protein
MVVAQPARRMVCGTKGWIAHARWATAPFRQMPADSLRRPPRVTGDRMRKGNRRQ